MTSENEAHAIDGTNLKFINKFSIRKLSLFAIFERKKMISSSPKLLIHISAE